MNDSWRQCFSKLGLLKEIDRLTKVAYAKGRIFPSQENVFRAFQFFKPAETKVVLIGQDPYHGFDQANGLSFSVKSGQKIPPSLRNLFKELQTDLDCDMPNSGDLEPWATQGVLMLNAVLTVEEGNAGSHQSLGWQNITKAVLKQISEFDNVVFILLGAWAQKFAEDIDLSKHKVIKTHHPSPLSAHRGFFGSKIYSECNAYLKQNYKTPINWAIHQNKQYELTF
jgi:uracil-DNA glycosylase